MLGTVDLGVFPQVFGTIARDKPESVRLVVVGPIEDRFKRHLSAAIPADSLEIRDPVPHREALDLMATSDVLIVFTAGGGSASNTVTGKLFEYMALHRPVLVVGPQGPATALVKAAGAGVYADHGDANGLVDALARVVALAADAGFEGARDEVLRRFDRRALAERWADLLSAAAKLPGHDGA
jgi:glycosyltransferase involved in cell wall biosynthesis